MGLERLYGTFSGVAAMEIWSDKLELDLPILIDDVPVVSTGFIVEDL